MKVKTKNLIPIFCFLNLDTNTYSMIFTAFYKLNLQ